MVFGTFDMVHSGHKHMFRQARALVKNDNAKNTARADKLTLHALLIVSIARDKNVKRIKGRSASRGERARLAMVARVAGVNKVVLGGTNDHMPHIIKEKPDIIALGYDQVAYVKGLKTALKQAGLKTKVIRLASHKPHIYKTSLLSKSRAKI